MYSDIMFTIFNGKITILPLKNVMLHGYLCSDLDALHNDGYDVPSPVSMFFTVTCLGYFATVLKYSYCGSIGGSVLTSTSTSTSGGGGSSFFSLNTSIIV